ncbi:MAG: deoxyguanosinetriphosphate triphosphohydrolase [Anaerolineae bacterium]|nr:deoxyguanosinetriphosphate triphosphohydrolase [Anaerolineae bacterium]MDW8102188.1 deoxyguanosinetriphosphate triphosphohydrolase [Anaerolineae bacterium]
MRQREQLEEIELLTLAPYAVKSRESRGREYPEKEHPYRTAFQRDRDRIIHTTAFRRLEYKTQVFVYYEGDYYRTRLTHTLEVAQLGRTIARALGANEDLVEAIALAHDLGHTPFGHSGEEALHELMANYGGFDHNRQSLRIVTLLERRYPDFPGLNLTWEVREGLAKHTTEYDRGTGEGYEPHKLPSLEAQIVNIADEIAYSSHDLDDGLRAGILNPSSLLDISIGRELVKELRINVNAFDDLARHRLIRKLIDWSVSDTLEETTRRLERASPRSAEEVRKCGQSLVSFSEEMTSLYRELKTYLMENFYRHYRVVRMMTKAKRLIADLFHAYMSEPRQLPEGVRARLAEEELPRIICDYIAGMTDRFALQEHRKLFDPFERA